MPTSEPYAYFQPGELLLLLTHARDEQIDDQVNLEEGDPSKFDKIIDEWIESHIDFRAKQHNASLQITRGQGLGIHFVGTLSQGIPPGQGIDYPGSTNGLLGTKRHSAYSLIPIEVRLPTGDRVDGSELVDLMIYLDNMGMRTDLEENLDGRRSAGPRSRIIVDTVLLNWLASAASEYGGGGGPGTRPVPYQGTSATAPFRFEIPEFRSLLSSEGDKSHQGEGVIVAILDTARSLQDMSAAYQRYHKVVSLRRTESHPLIESLFRRDGPLQVHPASQEDLFRMRAVHLRDHDYDMRDHGIFIAGIVHTIAPEAEIHLYEVLNPSGVGDLFSIAKGLREVLSAFRGQRLVVNCSLTLNIPLLNHPVTNLDIRLATLIFDEPNYHSDQEEYLTIERFQRGCAWLARQAMAIEWACDQFLWQGARVIAAAGNDWKSNKTRPQARFPAAFDSVLGVGALPKNEKFDANKNRLPANYSNLADAPEKCGIVTLGGESGEENGILGVYLGEFPPAEFLLTPLLRPISTILQERLLVPKNNNNWAWWAGTSFATPIVTGLTALAFSDLQDPAITEDAIGKLYKTQVVQESVTGSGEAGIVGIRQV